MSRVALAFLAVTVALALAVAGCARMAPSDIQITLDNLTDTPVGLYVNEDWVGTYPAGGTTRPPLGDHGGAPYEVEVRSPSGATLATVAVNEAQADSLSGGGAAIALEQGVPCGIVRLLVGELAADEVPAPAASVPPGPCP
ncbi:hypothetical protein BH20CHL7_BH20CHL7_09950 [soil metagenome]